MTAQEAIKDIVENGIELGAGDYVDVEALKVAVIALEKQIPKKLLPPPNEDDLMFGFCPNCKEEIYCSCSELSHCCKCGQAIKQEDL